MSATPPAPPETSADDWPQVSLAAGDILFRAGDPAESFFVVLTGDVAVQTGEAGAPLALLGAGHLVGEDAAFTGQPRQTEARARTAATLLQVPVEAFLALVRVRPDTAAAVIRTLAADLHAARMAGVAVRPPVGPVAPHFVDTATGAAFPVPEGADIVVGRSDAATRFMPDVDLSPLDNDRSLSRRHAVLHRDGDRFTLTEGPRVANGTAVNGTRLVAAQAVPLADGDQVSFGLVRTIFRLR